MTSGAAGEPWWRESLPPQERGRRRRAQIVAAARELIDAHGPHSPEVSIRGITDRAATSAATIYHYFADVEAVYAAVAAEYMEGLIVDIDAAIEGADAAAGGTGDPNGQALRLLDDVLDTYQRRFAAHPGLRELWFDHRASPAVVEIHQYYLRHFAATMRTALGRYTDTPGTELDHVIGVTVASALWELAFTLDPHGDQTVISQLRDTVRNHWHRRYGIEPT